MDENNGVQNTAEAAPEKQDVGKDTLNEALAQADAIIAAIRAGNASSEKKAEEAPAEKPEVPAGEEAADARSARQQVRPEEPDAGAEEPVSGKAEESTAAEILNEALASVPRELIAAVQKPETTGTVMADAPATDETAEPEENETEASDEKPAKDKKRKTKRIAIIAAATAVALGLGGFFLYRYQQEEKLLNQDTLYAVITEDADLTGMTREQAAEALAEAYSDELLAGKLTLTAGDEEYTVELSRFSPCYDRESALEEAWNVGREGTRSQRLTVIRAARKTPVTVTVPSSMDEAAVADYVTELAKKVDCEKIEPSFEVNPDAAGTDDLFLITEEQTGRKLDQEAAKEAILNGFDNDFAPIALTVAEDKPETTLAQLQEHVQLIRTFTTEYNANQTNRTFNIHRATDTINGTVLQPGEEFSFNRIVGNTSLAENGYKEAGVIIGGRSATDRGGGVCQAATTLYNCAVRCDMRITQRDPHSIASSYVPKGQDATIAYGACDLKFINTSEYPIYIFGTHTADTVTFTIYGEPLPDGESIEMESEIIATHSPGSPKETVDYSKPVGYRSTEVSALNGYDVRVYKIRYDAAGNEISRVVDHVDEYPTRRAVYIVGGASVSSGGSGDSGGTTPSPEPEPEQQTE